MSDKKTKTPDILDEVKKIEKATKRALLIKTITNLKELCKKVFEAKEEAVIRLQTIGIEEEDIKRIIDFVNELPGTKLTEEEKKELKERIKKEIQGKKKEITEKIEKKVESYVYTQAPFSLGSQIGSNNESLSGWGYSPTTTNVNFINSTTGEAINIKI